MTKLQLTDADGSFEVTRLDAVTPSRVVLFAVGGGGDPARHAPLLNALVERGCTIVAPHFERLVSPIPTAEHLHLRARRLRLALDSAAPSDPSRLPVAGVGHSLGATMLLALAGATAWTFERERLDIARDGRLERLALLAPATNFFRAPGALDGLRVTILAWAGTSDALTPPAQAELLKEATAARVEVRVVEGAGHFSFMNQPPPQTPDPLSDREAFLERLASEVGAFVA